LGKVCPNGKGRKRFPQSAAWQSGVAVVTVSKAAFIWEIRDMPNHPLTGLRVLDFSRVLAGPFATRMLADLGADVLKVEPPEGDMTRTFGVTRAHEGGQSGYYLQNNLGKRDVCIDMKADGARELILKLAAKADLVVENFRPGVMDKFGIGWSDLSKVNPKLVMMSISGFGQTGPDSKRPAYAPIIHAEAGIIARQAKWAGGKAADVQMSLADTYSSLHGLVGALAALRMADQTGKGQHLDIAMLSVMHATDDFAPYILDGIYPLGNESFVWDAPEGKQALVSGELKWLWHVYKTAGIMLKADVSPDADLAAKIAARKDALAAHFVSHATFKDFTDELDSLNLPWGLVRDVGDDAYTQATVKHRNMLVDITDDHGDPRRVVQSPYKFSDADSGITSDTKAPKRGEHNVSALEDWIGMAEGDVEALLGAGVLLAEDGL